MTAPATDSGARRPDGGLRPGVLRSSWRSWCWLFLAFYPVFVGLDLILFGATLNSIIVAHGGPDLPWWLLMLIGLVVIWGVAVLGIRLSVRSDLALLTFELGVLLALALTILVKGAPGGDWHPHVLSSSCSSST